MRSSSSLNGCQSYIHNRTHHLLVVIVTDKLNIDLPLVVLRVTLPRHVPQFMYSPAQSGTMCLVQESSVKAAD